MRVRATVGGKEVDLTWADGERVTSREEVEIHVLYFMKTHKQDYIYFYSVLGSDLKILKTKI